MTAHRIAMGFFFADDQRLTAPSCADCFLLYYIILYYITPLYCIISFQSKTIATLVSLSGITHAQARGLSLSLSLSLSLCLSLSPSLSLARLAAAEEELLAQHRHAVDARRVTPEDELPLLLLLLFHRSRRIFIIIIIIIIIIINIIYL